MSDNYLNSDLVLRQAWDSVNEGLKIVPAVSTEFSIELDAADGDNVTAKPDVALVENTTAVSAVGMKSANLYIEAGVAATIKLQVSPVDSGDVWMDVTGGSVANDPANLKATGVLSICARRVRLVVVAGTPVYHLVMQSV